MALVKVILKKIFPIPFLKKAFLVYNTFKIHTLDKLVYKELYVPNKDFQFYRNALPFRTERINLDDLYGRPEYPYMLQWLDWSQEEFIFTLDKQCTIEPEQGWAMIGNNTLVYQSLALSRTMHLRKPSLVGYWLRKNIQHVSHAISMRDTGEENYFHFYNDVLAKLFFLVKNGIAILEFPVIVSRKLWDKPFFQYYLSISPDLKNLHWIIQDNQYIISDRTIFCKPLTHRKDLLDVVFAPLRKIVNGDKKFFLTRNKARLRFLENAAQIEGICSKYGLEVIDTDELTMPQQIDIFSKATLIIGIHGAGLTNIMFSKGNCRILELFPPPDLGYLPFHYIMLAKLQGHKYRALIGDRPTHRFSGGFRISIDKLESTLVDLL